ncbi:MAG: OmpA family protein [Bacteriovorax sp.]|nr:OmpA family protein [Rhizobacter sp.]
MVGRGASHAAAAPVAAAAVAAAPVAADAASFKVEGGVVKFFFASGKAELAGGASAALADVAKGVADGKKAIVGGFTDPTGDAATNEELAKQRAFAVRDALKVAGVAEDKIELKKLDASTGGGDKPGARRVEVALQ